MTEAPPELRADLEIIRGADDLPMIFDPVTGTYHRVSRSAEMIIRQLDGSRSRDELVAHLSRGGATGTVARELDPFLAALDRSGLLVGSEIPTTASGSTRTSRSMLMPRVVLTRSVPRLLEPLARVLRSWPMLPLTCVVGIVAVLGYTLGAVVLAGSAGRPPTDLGIAVLCAIGVQLVYILVHELAHALVAQVNGVPVRGLGVALLFYFMPVAYVDRTDAYRLRAKGGRIALALAGIGSDGILCGVTAAVALNSSGLLAQTALVLLGLQLLGLVVNLNPLLPSDGYAAIEAATGLVDARGRAFDVLKASARLKPLPTHLVHVSAAARRGYALFGAACILYTLVLAVFVGSALVRAVVAAIGPLS